MQHVSIISNILAANPHIKAEVIQLRPRKTNVTNVGANPAPKEENSASESGLPKGFARSTLPERRRGRRPGAR